MPRKCSICSHKKRNEIELALIEGKMSFRHIASHFGVNYRSLQRHRQNGHIEESLVKAHELKQLVHSKDLLWKILHLQEETLRVLQQAKESNNHKTVLDAVGKASGLIELQVKLAGKLQEKQINIFLQPQFIELRTIIMKELEPYPEIKYKIAEALQENVT